MQFDNSTVPELFTIYFAAFWLPITPDFLPRVCFGHPERCLNPAWVSWLAVACNVSGCLISFGMARVAGAFRGKFKSWIIALFVLAGICFSYMSLVALKVVSFQVRPW